MAKKNNHNQYLVDFVQKLKNLNNLELDIPGGDIKTVIENPEEYALNFVEFQITKNLKNYIAAYKMGKEFANKNMGVKDGEKK
jgi:hypothetical protein